MSKKPPVKCAFSKKGLVFSQLESVNFDSLRVGTGTLFRTNSAEEARNGFCYSAEKSAPCEAFRGPRKLRKKLVLQNSQIILTK